MNVVALIILLVVGVLTIWLICDTVIKGIKKFKENKRNKNVIDENKTDE